MKSARQDMPAYYKFTDAMVDRVLDRLANGIYSMTERAAECDRPLTEDMECVYCGDVFEVEPSAVKSYCGRSCASRAVGGGKRGRKSPTAPAQPTPTT